MELRVQHLGWLLLLAILAAYVLLRVDSRF